MQEDALREDQIRQLIDEYTPSEETAKILSDNGLVIFVGVSGAGKNTIMNRLVATGQYHDAVTSTTRLPRENDGVMEQDGVEYYFLTTEQAIENIRSGEYVEVSWVHDRINGMLADELAKAAKSHQLSITDVDVQGAIKYRKLSDNVRLIFVMPPSFDEWDKRNRSRYKTSDDFEAAWPARRRSAIMELELALKEDIFEFVVNDTIDDTVAEVIDILSRPINIDQQHAGRQVASDILAALQQS